MRDLMDLVQHAFYKQTGWDLDNSYATLTQTAQCMFSVRHLAAGTY